MLPPRILKIDVEGAELKVLKGANVLKKYKPTIFLAVHDRQLAEDCFNLLKEEFNYTLSPIISDDILKTSEIIAFSKKI